MSNEEKKKKVNEEKLEKVNGGYLTSEAAEWLNKYKPKIMDAAMKRGVYKQALKDISLVQDINCEEYSLIDLKILFRKYCDVSNFN